MRIIGIDPGMLGGIAWIDQDGTAGAQRMPKTTKGLIKILKEVCTDDCLVVVEKMWAKPFNGSKGNFKIGQNYGEILAILEMLGVSHEVVAPQTWQIAMLPEDYKRKHRDTKEASLVIARNLYPSVSLKYQRDHGKSDALLIAEWRRRMGTA